MKKGDRQGRPYNDLRQVRVDEKGDRQGRPYNDLRQVMALIIVRATPAVTFVCSSSDSGGRYCRGVKNYIEM